MVRIDPQVDDAEVKQLDQDAFTTNSDGDELWFDDLKVGESHAFFDELSILLEPGFNPSSILSIVPPSYAQVSDELNLDEPETLAEFDGDLRDPLYEIIAEGFAEQTRELKIDQLVASVNETTNEQYNQISGMLGDFSNARLRNWLAWLPKKDWTGPSLLLFLGFYSHWEANPQWWEYWYRDMRIGFVPGFSRNILTRDDAYILVQQRLYCKPDQVIDRTWYEDWEVFELWRYGFDSFLSFARFRSDFDDGKDWRHFLGLDDRDADWWLDNDYLDHESNSVIVLQY